jgi:hypothetical protein
MIRLKKIFEPGCITTINFVASHSSAFCSLLNKPHPLILLLLEKDGAALQIQTTQLPHQLHIIVRHFRSLAFIIGVIEKWGLCVVPLLKERLGEVLGHQRTEPRSVRRKGRCPKNRTPVTSFKKVSVNCLLPRKHG